MYLFSIPKIFSSIFVVTLILLSINFVIFEISPGIIDNFILLSNTKSLLIILSIKFNKFFIYFFRSKTFKLFSLLLFSKEVSIIVIDNFNKGIKYFFLEIRNSFDLFSYF